ncbi:MAG: glycosyltransferase family 2 protein [Lachnotalea sp.]
MKSTQTNNPPLISIIIPIYNCELFINECINSIISQSYTNLQIIFIDDGSTDKSGTICDEFAQLDQRIIVIHQKNSGVSSARNKGLSYANGKYIAFIDSDDYVAIDFIEKLYHKINFYDIVISGYYRVESTGLTPKIQENIPVTLSHDSLYHYVLCNNFLGGYLWNKLFCTEIIIDHNICFNTSLSIGEDMLWIATYLKYVNQGTYIPEGLYFYRTNSNSALQQSYTTHTFSKKNLSNLDSADLIIKVIINEDKPVQDSMSYRYVRTSMWTFFNMLTCNYYDRNLLKRIETICRSNLKIYLKANESKLLEKLVAIGIAMNSNLTYKIASLLFSKLPKRFIKKYLN